MMQNLIRKQRLTLIFLPLMTFFAVFLMLFSGDDIANVTQKWAYSIGFALLVAGLAFAFLTTQDDQNESVFFSKKPAWVVPVGAGLLSLLCMAVAYSAVGMWPLGDKTTMTVDMHHQYAPMLAGMRSWLLSGELDLYQFEVGMGANFLSQFGYYLASPLNLLLVFFPEPLLAEGILSLLLIKCFLAGAFCALFLSKVYDKTNPAVYLISVCYALMMYCIAYAWNHMWMDVVMLMPLVLYGLERLLNRGKYGVYCVALAVALFSNYYIGFMLCIFLVCYFVWTLVRQPITLRAAGKAFARFAVGSLTGGFMAMGLLIPVYLALQQTSAAGGELPDLATNFSFLELFTQGLVGVDPTIRSGNLPNIYCGTLAVLLLPVFLTTKQIPMRRRAGLFGLWALMAASFSINSLDLIWHGLHSPNDLPYRFSFLYSFVLLLIAFETLQHITQIKPLQIGLSAGGLAVLLLVQEQFAEEELSTYTVYGTLLLLALYTAVLLIGSKQKLKKAGALALVLAICCCEMAANGGYSFKRLNNNEVFTNHYDYVDNEITELLSDSIKDVQAIGDKTMGNDFYRLEFAPRRTCVDTALFQYRGITTFSSSNYYSTTRCLGAFGYEINGVNSHLFQEFNPVIDSIFGLRYLMLEDTLNDDRYTITKTYQSDAYAYSLYENKDALPLGFVTGNNMTQWEYSYYNPIDTINSWYAAALDTDEQMLELVPIQTANPEGLSLYGTGGFSLSGDGDLHGEMEAVLSTPGRIYLYVDCRAASDISLDFNDTAKYISPSDPHMVYAGMCEEGDTVRLTISAKSTASGNFYVAKLNEALYEKAVAQLKAQGLRVTEFKNSRIKATLNTKTAGPVFTSIPYDSGWQVQVDGKPVSSFAVGESFLGFQVAAGDHDIQLVYRPNGFVLGLCLSAFGVLLLIALCLLGHKGLLPTQRPPRAKKVIAEDSTLPEISDDFWKELEHLMPASALEELPMPESTSAPEESDFPSTKD